jgi:uncharacterized glyoxalase superfamily protein PhnB
VQIDSLVPLLNVENTQRSIDFYTGTLSFQVVQDFIAHGRTVWAMLQNGDVKLMVNETGHSDRIYRRTRPSYGDAVLYLYVDSAREWHDKLTASGANPSGLTAEAYGMEEFRLRDPDGYEIAVGSPLTRIAG